MSQLPLQTYTDVLDYLYSFINWEVSREMRYSPEVMTLARPRKVMEALGNPHETYPVVHITGTKGKGSVGAMTSSALQAAGLRVGLYSSPHLQDFRERFRVNNHLIGESELLDLVNLARDGLDNVPGITWFEVTTALAFLYFAQQKVDVAVIEVGLGGRLDATNIVTPAVSVITSLSYDHMNLLGDSLSSIATEKAGIIKPGVPVVSAPQPPEALEVLSSIASERGSALTVVGHDWYYKPGKSQWDRQTFTAWREGQEPESYMTKLSGEHQVVNATVAIATLDVLREAGLAVDTRHVQAGLMNVDWPARLEIVADRSPVLVLDVAHNGASARWLQAALTDLFPGRETAFIFGAFADKDVDGMFDALLPIANHLIVSQAIHPRALSSEELAERARQWGYTGDIYQIPAAADALERANQLVGADGVVITTGSLSIVGEMRTVVGLPVGHVVPFEARSLHIPTSTD